MAAKAWNIDGIRIWKMNGICVEYAWNMDEICKEYAWGWNMYRKIMEHVWIWMEYVCQAYSITWNMYGIGTVRHGICMEHGWNVCGTCMEYVWNV